MVDKTNMNRIRMKGNKGKTGSEVSYLVKVSDIKFIYKFIILPQYLSLVAHINSYPQPLGTFPSNRLLI